MSTLFSVEVGNLPLCQTFTMWNQAASHCVQSSQCGIRQPPIVSNFHSVETGNLPLCQTFTVKNQATSHCVKRSQYENRQPEKLCG